MALAVEVAVALEEQDEQEKVAKLEETMRSFIDMEKLLVDHSNTVKEVQSMIRNQQSEEEVDYIEYIESKAEALAQHEPRYKEHSKYREFRQKVWAVHHPDEALPDEAGEDLVVMSTQEQEFMCPLTRTQLVDPVKNKAAIVQHIKTSRRGKAACPVAGCDADVSMSSLEADPETEYRLQRLAKRPQRHKKAAHNHHHQEYTQL